MSTLLAKMVLCPWMHWLIWKYARLQPQVELGCKISQLDIEWPHARSYPTDIFWTLPGCAELFELGIKINPLTDCSLKVTHLPLKCNNRGVFFFLFKRKGMTSRKYATQPSTGLDGQDHLRFCTLRNNRLPLSRTRTNAAASFWSPCKTRRLGSLSSNIKRGYFLTQLRYF